MVHVRIVGRMDIVSILATQLLKPDWNQYKPRPLYDTRVLPRPLPNPPEVVPIEPEPRASFIPVTKPETAPTGDVLGRIKQCESGGSYTAQNAHSTASGAYQVLDSTWNRYGGYARAKDAPPEVQEQFAQQLYNRSGTTPWNASRSCWS